MKSQCLVDGDSTEDVPWISNAKISHASFQIPISRPDASGAQFPIKAMFLVLTSGQRRRQIKDEGFAGSTSRMIYILPRHRNRGVAPPRPSIWTTASHAAAVTELFAAGSHLGPQAWRVALERRPINQWPWTWGVEPPSITKRAPLEQFSCSRTSSHRSTANTSMDTQW